MNPPLYPSLSLLYKSTLKRGGGRGRKGEITCKWLGSYPGSNIVITTCIYYLFVNPIMDCSVAIRGDHQDEAVLCTDKATFDLRTADTSNSLLLVPHCAVPKDEGEYLIKNKDLYIFKARIDINFYLHGSWKSTFCCLPPKARPFLVASASLCYFYFKMLGNFANIFFGFHHGSWALSLFFHISDFPPVSSQVPTLPAHFPLFLSCH